MLYSPESKTHPSKTFAETMNFELFDPANCKIVFVHPITNGDGIHCFLFLYWDGLVGFMHE